MMRNSVPGPVRTFGRFELRRLLGKSVTHGCVRLGAQDLEVVYDAAPLHTKVLIF